MGSGMLVANALLPMADTAALARFVPVTMDRKIKKRKWPPRRIAGLSAIVLFAALSTYGFLKDSGIRKLNVQREKLTISTVERGPFQEFTPVRGTVMPIYTVYLDALEGGRVESVFLEEGATVKEGDPILRLGNPDLELQVLNQEAELSRRREELLSGELEIEQNLLRSRQELMEIEFQLRINQRKYDRYASLSDRDRVAMMARQEFEKIKDDFEFTTQKRQLTVERHHQDSLLAVTQFRQLGSVHRTATAIPALTANAGVSRKYSATPLQSPATPIQRRSPVRNRIEKAINDSTLKTRYR